MDGVRRRTRPQDGFTLVELLIAATLMLLLLTASLTALASVERGQRDVSSRTDELGEATAGVERMSREMREASALLVPTAASVPRGSSVTTNSVSVTTRVYTPASNTAANKTVTFACGGGICSRTADGVTQTLITGVTSTNPFTVTNVVGSPNYVTWTIGVDARGETVTLSDGVRLRNLS